MLLTTAVAASSCSNNSGAGAGNAAAATDASVGGSGSDVYYEYTTHSTGTHMTIDGSSKLWISAAGKMRRETLMSNPANQGKNTAIVLIADAARPGETISIDDSARKWSVNHVDSAGLSNDVMKKESSVSKIGEEKILGFTCVHARIITHKSMGSFINETDTIDLWKSDEVPVPTVFKSISDRLDIGMGILFAKEVPAQLKQMGCDGFLVRMDMHGKDVTSKTELTKVERKDLPGSLFSTPAGYKEDKNGGF